MLDHVERENQRLVSKFDELQRKYKNEKKARGEAQGLLDVRTTELKEAQEFLSMTDDIPDTELVRIVQALNASIFQVAAAIVDEPRLCFSPRSVNRRKVSPPLGMNYRLFSLMRSLRSDELPTAVQVALQEGIANSISNLASTWDFCSTKDGDRLFSDLYRRIRSRGTPFISGKKW